MLQTGGKYSAGFARYDYALRNYKDVYTGGSRSVGYVRNTDREKQYARSVVNQQISNLLSKNGISISKQADLVFSIDPYTYQLTVSGNADRDILSQIEKLLNEGDNAKNIWTHAWICMHDADNEIVNSQANMTKANQYSLWHEVYETTGYDARNATYKNGTFIAEDGTDLLALFKEKSKNGAGYELYSKRWLQYAKNGWKKENDLVLKIGFDSSGLYDIGQEKGYGAAQNMWMKGVSQSMFEARKMIRSLDREDAKEIPIIAMTANAFTEDRIRAKEAGMDEHIVKPVDVGLLIKVIHKLVKYNGYGSDK